MSHSHACLPNTDFQFVCDACRTRLLENYALRKDIYSPKKEQFFSQLYFWVKGRVWWAWVDPQSFGGDSLENWTTIDKDEYQLEMLINTARIAGNETPTTFAMKMWEHTTQYLCMMYAPVSTKHKALF
jgi:hypothetical protein